jgi:hypothetical protein
MSQATWSRENFGKIPKNLPQFQEESYDITRIFGGFGRISTVLLLKSTYLFKRF